MNVTIKDVAERAGVSIATVSKYLNGGHLREKYRSRVEEAVSALDYKVNEVARNLKKQRTFLIGVLTPGIACSYNAQVATAIQACLLSRGYTALILDYRNNGETEEKLLDVLIRWHVDGVLLMPCLNEVNIVRKARRYDIPLVLVDSVIFGEECDCVVTDNYASSYAAVKHMISMGHTRIAALTGEDTLYTPIERKKGYEDAMREAGLTPYSVFGHFTSGCAHEATLRIMREKDPPTALFSTNANMTLGMLAALRELKLAVPEDVSVAVYDEIELEPVLPVQLSTIRQPTEPIAAAAVQLILDRIENGGKKDCRMITIRNDVSYTESVRPLKHN